MTSGSNVDQSSPLHESRVAAFKQELTRQPYAGYYLFYLLFKESSDDYEIVEQALSNATQFDFLVYISLMEDEQLEQGLDSYFDGHKRMVLADRFEEERSTEILTQVIDLLVHHSEQLDARQYLQAEFTQFLQLAGREEGSQVVEELRDRLAETKESEGFDLLE